MSEYAIAFRPGAVQDFAALPERAKVKVAQALEHLRLNPLYSGTRALQGNLRPFRRARAGDLRIIYLVELDEKRIRVVAIGLRSDIYKRLSRMSE